MSVVSVFMCVLGLVINAGDVAGMFICEKAEKLFLLLMTVCVLFVQINGLNDFARAEQMSLVKFIFPVMLLGGIISAAIIRIDRCCAVLIPALLCFFMMLCQKKTVDFILLIGLRGNGLSDEES